MEQKHLPTLSSMLQAGKNDCTGSQLALHVCFVWLRRCVATHEECRTNHSDDKPSFRPKQLIDVNDNGIRLVTTSIKVEVPMLDYVALSHCWGPVPIICTSKENYHNYQSAIDPEKLSKIFKGAIHAARALSSNTSE
ncbi:hypothetical protein BU25DRAFT_156221 [Macroventuria anomochaeta]|uniref:Uncharacterized protein n=1 Tax=Macroventuria anomochaeta TaxID=301207 RepID=A0ACB6RU67_9PLEO|nr:uncharacterized protein BU25DRAFT_156221 [Macroventuria anomochaeta]KAF2624608.1 hypothetical protein BU25DRAFT_156221 [Macroventuria anomochaeta]